MQIIFYLLFTTFVIYKPFYLESSATNRHVTGEWKKLLEKWGDGFIGVDDFKLGDICDMMCGIGILNYEEMSVAF